MGEPEEIIHVHVFSASMFVCRVFSWNVAGIFREITRDNLKYRLDVTMVAPIIRNTI